jgi:hypothetical protein
LSFPLVGNPSEKKDSGQARMTEKGNPVASYRELQVQKRRTTMKKLGIITLILLLAAGIAYAKDYEVKKKAGAYDVEVKIDKNPPIVGDNNIEIEVKDGAGKYVTDAKIRVEYSMPAMPGMPPMSYKTDAALKGNEYKAIMNLSMSGPWNITVRITHGGKTTPVRFNVDAR